MQLGHVAIALSISTYNWNPKTILLAFFFHFLPNLDVIPIRLGLAKPEFHFTVTHSLLFAAIVSLFASLFGYELGALAIVCLITHYAADFGCSRGQPLLYPFSDKKFSLPLFDDTGFWGKEAMMGYYEQPWSWILESIVFLFLIYRLTVLYYV